MIPDDEVRVLTEKGLQRIEQFLHQRADEPDWIANDMDQHRVRIDLLHLRSTSGALCWLCAANVAVRKTSARWFTACKHCCANDAVAARELGLNRLLPVWLAPGGTIEGTVAERDQEDQTAEEDRLSAWFFDAAPAQEWADWLIPLLAQRGRVTQRVDVSMLSWQRAVGATRRDAALRYVTLLEMKFPGFIQRAPNISDPEWLATQRVGAR